jgi:hypothetical protein
MRLYYDNRLQNGVQSIKKNGSSQFCGDTTQMSEYGQGELLDKAA